MGVQGETALAVAQAGISALTGGPVAAGASAGRSAAKIGLPLLAQRLDARKTAQKLEASLTTWGHSKGYGDADLELGLRAARDIINSFGVDHEGIAALNYNADIVAREVLRRGNTTLSALKGESVISSCKRAVRIVYANVVDELLVDPALVGTREVLRRLPPGGQPATQGKRFSPVDAGTVPVHPLVEGYRREIQALLPATLKERGSDLEDIAEFIANPNLAWRWWRAGPWSGKSALMASVALGSFTNAEFVYFFILGRQQGANSRRDFYSAVLPQLAAIAGAERMDLPTDPRQAQSHLLYWLSEAAAKSATRDKSLVLLVDGLDEDVCLLDPPSRQSSIAGALPILLPENTKIIVASRENPELGADVSEKHPLLEPNHWRQLTPSDAADAARKAAVADIRDLMQHPLGKDVAGFLAAAGAPLTLDDLAELTQGDALELEYLVAGSRPGRSFVPVASTLEGPGRVGYRLGHDKLDELLIELLAVRGPRRGDVDPQSWTVIRRDTLRPWHQRLADWGAGWARADWPRNTPGFLLDPAFPALLSLDAQNVRLLVEVVSSRLRNELLFGIHRTDYLAVAQIDSAAAWLVREPEMNLSHIGYLMGARDGLLNRFTTIAPGAFGLLVKLGEGERATHIAQSIATPRERVNALAEMSHEYVLEGAIGQARSLAEAAVEEARNIGDKIARLEAQVLIAVSLVELGEPELAEQIAAGVIPQMDSGMSAATSIRLAHAFAEGDATEIALRLLEAAQTRARDGYQWGAYAALSVDKARHLLNKGLPDRATESAEAGIDAASRIHDPTLRAGRMVDLAGILGDIGDLSRARSLLAAVSATRHDTQTVAKAILAYCAIGDIDQAIAVLPQLNPTTARLRAIAELVQLMVRQGISDKASTLWDPLESTCRHASLSIL